MKNKTISSPNGIHLKLWKWHVRTRENMVRVRKDQAKAAEEEKEKQRRIALADKEARISILREKAKEHSTIISTSVDQSVSSGHVNLFADISEKGTNAVAKPNAEYLKEKKEETEAYEKKIGYLTYLGQDTNEALKTQNWYEIPPERSSYTTVETEKDINKKFYHDPLNVIKRYLPDEKSELKTPKLISELPLDKISTLKTKIEKHRKNKKYKHRKSKKSKKHKKHRRKSSSSSRSSSEDSSDEEARKQKKEMLERLRKARLEREAEEKKRQELLIKKAKGEPVELLPEPATNERRVKQKYNNQFNPDLAKQNFDL